MNASTGQVRPRRGFRVKPIRLIAVLALVTASAWGLRWARGTPYVALSWPAPDPLGARTGLYQMELAAEAALGGRGLAVHAAADGTAAAVVTDGDRTWLVMLSPDAQQARVGLNLPGEPAHAAFIAGTRLAVWIPAPPGGSGGTLAAVPVPAAGQTRTAVNPVWHVQLPGTVFGLVPLQSAVAVIGGGPEGIPQTCLVVGIADGKTLWQVQVADGLFTAWGGAIPAGGLALAGAQYDGRNLSAFARLYSASGKLLCNLQTSDGPAYLAKPSPTGRYVLLVTRNRLRLVTSDGGVLWSAALPSVRVDGCMVGGDGQVLLSTGRNTLALDQRGAVRARWRSPGLSALAEAPGAGAIALGLSGGVAVLDGAGRLTANLRAGGVSTLISLDTEGVYLCRAADGVLAVYALAPD